MSEGEPGGRSQKTDIERTRPEIRATGAVDNPSGQNPILDSALRRHLEGLSLVSRRRLASRGQGDRRSRLRGSSLELVDFRAYTPGDDLRQVDWNVFGRSGELFVRLYEDERTLSVHLLLDVSPSMDWGMPNKRQVALQLAGALSYIALSGFDRLFVAFLGERVVGQVGPFWGQHQRAAALAALADAPTARQTDFGASVADYVGRLRLPGLLILVTDLLSPTAEAGLRRLAGARNEAIVLHLLAPQELDPEPAEDIQLVDQETGQTIDLSLDLETLARYRARLAAWSDGLARLCRERNARYLRLSTGDDLERGMVQALRQHGIVA